MTIKDIDKGWKTIKRLAKLGPAVDVGFLGVKGSQLHKRGQQSVAQVASYHEYGHQLPSGKWRPPRRSMLYDWVADAAQEHVQTSELLADRMIQKKITLQQAIGQLGAWAQGSIQKRFTPPPSSWKPLSQVTIDRKGSSAPLIDTGQMRASIGHRPSK